jgi:hypothetical protein
MAAATITGMAQAPLHFDYYLKVLLMLFQIASQSVHNSRRSTILTEIHNGCSSHIA